MKDFVFYTKGIEYKSFFDDKSNSKRYFIKGHIDSEDLDLVNDIVTKNCMQDLENQLKGRSIKLDFDHETLRAGSGDSDFDTKLNLTKIPLGKSIDSEMDIKGNLVEFELNPNWKKFDSKGNVVMTFKEVWDNVKSGFYDAFSIAYVPVKTASKMVGDVKARMLDKINLINVALTGNPINPSATMRKVFAKSLDYVSEFDELRNELAEIKNILGSRKMTEENLENVNEVQESNSEKVESEVVESSNEVVKEETKPEEKSKEYVEVKSFVELKSKIDILEKSLSKIDEILSKSLNFGLGAENKSEKSEVQREVKSNETLNLI